MANAILSDRPKVNSDNRCGAGGLTPLGVRIPPPVHCPDWPTSQESDEPGCPKGEPHAWELLYSARNMIALAELSVMFAQGVPPPIA